MLCKSVFFFLTGGGSKVVGIYFPDDDKIVFNGAEVIWQGSYIILQIDYYQLVSSFLPSFLPSSDNPPPS